MTDSFQKDRDSKKQLGKYPQTKAELHLNPSPGSSPGLETRIWLICGVLVVVLALIGAITWGIKETSSPDELAVNQDAGEVELLAEEPMKGQGFDDATTETVITPVSFSFEELTIPYLRNREYKSSLGKMNQALETQDYIGYITNYDSDGLKINSLLTVPKMEMPTDGYPAVVFVHGYIPPGNYLTLENYNTYVDALARQGLVVLKIDLRGHGNSEGEASGAYYSGDYVIDTLNAYAALEEADFVDPERIGLWGHSMAGNIVFRAFAAKTEIPKVVIWAGAVYTYEDFAEFRISDNSYQPPDEDSPRRRKREELFATYGQFEPESWFWQQVPATNYLDGLTGEIQVHHAVNDNVVDIGYSRNLVVVLDSTPIEHELFEYTTGGHNITGSAFTQAMERTAEFLGE